jgi:hypothetical protein
MTECVSYKPKFIDIFVPPLNIFWGLCKSYDKTYLFITSVIRVVLYYYLMVIVKDYQEFAIILKYIFIFNSILLCGVILKTTHDTLKLT